MRPARRIIVPDASVILKWVIPAPDENGRGKALYLLEGWLDERYEIILPKLWAFETANILGLKAPDRAGAVMEILLGYRFPEEETTPALCAEAFSIMRKCRVTFYDAVYHALAIMRGGVFVSADRKYIRKAAVIGSVAHLEDFT